MTTMTIRTASWAAAVWLAAAAPVASQTDGFGPLFDGTLNGWTVQNAAEDAFTVVDGALRVEGERGWLRSEGRYTDFVLRGEFRWLTADADSGIYIRAAGDEPFARGWPGQSYQVQVRDPSGESRFDPVGGLFRHGMPPGEHTLDLDALDRAYRGTGEWHTIEIELVGEALAVRLNGVEIARAGNIVRADGHVGIQSELGTMEYRSIEIRER